MIDLLISDFTSLQCLSMHRRLEAGVVGVTCARRRGLAAIPTGGTQVVDRRAGRIKEGTDRLAAALTEQIPTIEDVQVIFRPSVEHRAALVLRGPGLSHEISEVDPHDPGADYLDCEPLPGATDPEAAAKTARIVNAFVPAPMRSRQPSGQSAARRGRLRQHCPPVAPARRGTAAAERALWPERGDDRRGDPVQDSGNALRMDVIEVAGATGGQDTMRSPSLVRWWTHWRARLHSPTSRRPTWAAMMATGDEMEAIAR